MAVLLPSCASAPPRLTGIRLGMTKAELVKKIGKPHEVGAPVKSEPGRIEEFWEYVFPPDARARGRDVAVGVLTAEVGFFDDPTEDRHCVFYFVDDRLASWGPKKR